MTTQTTVNLSGTGSTDPDGDPLTYQWSQTSGPSVSLTGASTVTPSFTAPTLAVNAPDAVLTFQLIVNDGTVNSAADTVNVTVESIKNNAPTLSGTPSSVQVAEDVLSSLDLSAATFADADGDNLTVTLNLSAGNFSHPVDGSSIGSGVTALRVSANQIRLAGSPNDINTYLDTASNIGYTTPTDGTGPYTLTISASDGTAGLASNPSVTINVTATPDVTGVSASTADGHYNAGETVAVEVTFDTPVTVSGTPTLTLETGTTDRVATYTGGSGGSTLTFTYTVQAGDTTQDLDYTTTSALDLSGGSITGNGYAADLTLPSPGGSGSLGANKAIVIDTTAPVVTNAGISISGATGTDGAFKVGDTVTAEWNTAGSDGDINITGSLGSVTVDFSAFGGNSAEVATISGSVWTATYTIVANTSTSGANLNVSVTATDEAGNTATATDTGGATADANPPVVTAANISLSGATGTGGAFKIGDTVTASWNNTAGGDNNADITGVTVDFTQFGGGAGVAATNSSGTWTATYTITAGAIDAVSRSVSVSATDTTGNETTTAGTANATVDSQSPTVTDARVSISGASGTGGAFKVGDTVTASWNNTAGGDNNADIADVTVDFTQFGGSAAVAATNSSGTWTATYVITSGAIDANNRNVSVTATDDAGNASTTANTSNAVVDSQIPTVTLTSTVTGPHSGPFTVTATFPEAVTGFVIGDVTVGNGTASNFAGTGAIYTFDVTPAADGVVTIDVAASVAADAAGNDNAAAVQLTVTADGTGPTVSLTSNANNPHSGMFTVTATFSEGVTGFAIDDVTVGNGTASNFAGTGTTYTFDITPAADGVVTIDIGAGVAQDSAGNGNMASNQLSVMTDGTPPTVTITGPENGVVSDFTVTFTFSEHVTGFEASDVNVVNGSKSTFSGSNAVYTLVITNPILGTIVSVSVDANKAFDAAGNGNEASNLFEVQAGSPASEFEKYREEIQQVLVDEAARSLRSTLSSNQRMTQDARQRFIADQREREACAEEDAGAAETSSCETGTVSRNNVPFDVEGGFALNSTTVSTSGNFFEQTGNYEGTQRRLFFGDFDVQHDADTDSTTATLTARVAWERMATDNTMLGYFVGGELATSTIGGSFEGDQDRIGVTVGGYVVHELSEQVYFDGFASVGAGRNNLEMANDTLALESEYTTQTATLGGAITGVYSQKGYDFKPELAFSLGKTWLGDIGFIGRAYGLVDNTLSLDAGDVSIASLTFRPEVIIPIGADFVADSNTHFTYAPRLVCEQIRSTTKTSDCGTGGELGFSSTSEDGLCSADMRILLDRINGGTRSSFAFSVEHRF